MAATHVSPPALKMSHHHQATLLRSPSVPPSVSSPTINIHHYTPSHSQIKTEPVHLASPQSENELPSSSGIQSEPFSAKCKRKINFSHFPPNKHQPATVARRNARERNRVKQVNNGFSALKQHIPPQHRAKKMSKVETLRCAVEYIRDLQEKLDMTLMESDPSSSRNQYSLVSDFEGSYAGSRSDQMSPSSSEDPPETPFMTSSNPHHSNSAGFYDHYEPVSPDDEELLDAISLWQEN